MKSLAFIVAAAVFVTGTQGEVITPPDATGSLEGGVYTIAVPAGETNMICEANMEGINSSTVLKKRGAGMLFSSVRLSEYNGEIRVEEGTFLVSKDGHLGTKEGKTIVSNGASVVIWVGIDGAPSIHPDGYMGNDGNNQIFYTNSKYKEQWVLSGMGTEEFPGAVCTKGSRSARAYSALSQVELIGDTRLVAIDTRLNITYYGALNMNGHTLYFSDKVGYVCQFRGGSIINPGHIVIENGRDLLIETAGDWGGDALNTLTLQSGVGLSLRQEKFPRRWTLKVENGANVKYDSAYNHTSDDAKWCGPVELNAEIHSVCVEKNLSQFLGNVSGMGGFNASKGVLVLGGTNTYTGRTKLDGTGKDAAYGSEIRLKRPESYPAENENGIELIDADLVLDSTDSTFNLPLVKLAKTGTLKTTAVSSVFTDYSSNIVRKIEKTDEGVFNLNASVTVSNIVVSAGTVRIMETNSLPYGDAGLMLGTINERQTEDVNKISNYNIHCVEGTGPWVSINDWWDTLKSAQSWGAKGYLWNREPTNVTWSIGVSAQNRSSIYIDGIAVFKNVANYFSLSASKYICCTNIVLTPGTHEFRMITGNNNGSFGSQVEGMWALFYDPYGRCPFVIKDGAGDGYSVATEWNIKTYCKPLCDPGNGYVFTTNNVTAEAFRASAACAGVLPKIITAEFATGTILDLGGNRRYWVENLIGLPKIENGSEFCISNTWTVSASELEDTHIVTQSGLEFSERARLNIQDVDQLRHAGKSYVLCASEKVIVGKPSLGSSAVEAGWSVAVGGDAKTLELRSRRGMVIIIK